MLNVRLANPLILAALLAALPGTSFADDVKLEYHGAGWAQFGMVAHSSDTSKLDYNDNPMQSAGAVINSSAKVDDHWDGGLGLGVVQVHLIRGAEDNGNWYPFMVPFVSEARITYSTSLFTQQDKFKVSLGYIPYGYNPDVKDLGQYLLRGYVYPGTLVSGFGNISGAIVGYGIGGLHNDLILNVETEDKPLYDFSIADVANYQFKFGLEVGAGVNFYRVIAQNSDLTSPSKDCVPGKLGPAVASNPAENVCYIVDTVGTVLDTITGGYAGTKLMARFHFDPKTAFGFSGSLGKEDLVLYGEAAILGVKDYPIFYDDIARRIPAMVGFNFPAFGFLDNLSLEVEYYASKNSSDNLNPEQGSWLPSLNSIKYVKRDDWKWSVYAAKVLSGHMKLSAQAANDHLRLGGTHDLPYGVEAMNTPKDWYWTCKLAYFF